MKRIAAVLLSLSAMPALAAEQAPLATLSQQQGTVLVNQGEVFATAQEGQALQAGDRVLVMEGGEATLVFADGCALPVGPGSLLEVPAVSPCASGELAQVQKIGPHYAQAVGDDARSDRRGGGIWLAAGTLVLFYALTDNDPQELPPPTPISP